MIKDLVNYKNTLNEFTAYLHKQKIDIGIFYNNDFRHRIGFYVDFLSNKGINIIIDQYNYVIYYSVNNPISQMQVRIKKTIRISESNNNNEDNIIGTINNFKFAIIEAFKHLENPF